MTVLKKETSYRIYCWIAPSWSPLMYRWSPYCLNISERPSLSRCWLFARLIAITNRFFLNNIYKEDWKLNECIKLHWCKLSIFYPLASTTANISDCSMIVIFTNYYQSFLLHITQNLGQDRLQESSSAINNNQTSSLVWVSFSCSMNIFPSLVRT